MGQGRLNKTFVWMLKKLSVTGEEYPNNFISFFISSSLKELSGQLNQFNRPYVDGLNEFERNFC